MVVPNKTPSLAAKKAFIERSRRVNYRASLRLEGIKVSTRNDTGRSKTEIIAKYRANTIK